MKEINGDIDFLPVLPQNLLPWMMGRATTHGRNIHEVFGNNDTIETMRVLQRPW